MFNDIFGTMGHGVGGVQKYPFMGKCRVVSIPSQSFLDNKLINDYQSAARLASHMARDCSSWAVTETGLGPEQALGDPCGKAPFWARQLAIVLQQIPPQQQEGVYRYI